MTGKRDGEDEGTVTSLHAAPEPEHTPEERGIGTARLVYLQAHQALFRADPDAEAWLLGLFTQPADDGDRGRLQVLPGLRTGNVLTEPVQPDPMDEDTREFLGLAPWTRKCSDRECGRDAKWHLTACPGTDHEAHVLTCPAHLAPVHRSLLEDVACRPHQHEEPRTRPTGGGA